MNANQFTKPFKNISILFKQIFLANRFTWMQWSIILIISLLFIGMPQKPEGNDWELNTQGFWSDIPHTYLNNQNFVYPPWGLILLIPYYLMRAEGVRVLSVLTIGWLVSKRGWPLSHFLAMILSPYFLLTMSISNMDILVIILPVLIWEYAEGRRLESIGRGISLALMLLKPQCTLPIIIYLVWKNLKNWKGLLIPLTIAAFVVIPVSLIGSPPLIFQWANNLIHPSIANQRHWSINNLSLTANLGLWAALGICFAIFLMIGLLKRKKIIVWRENQTIAALLFSSMFLMPYTSMQSFIAGLAFTPSWLSFFFQWLVFLLGILTFSFYSHIHLWTFSIAIFSLLAATFVFKEIRNKTNKIE